MGGWCLGNPNLVRFLKTIRNIGRSITTSEFQIIGPIENTGWTFQNEIAVNFLPIPSLLYGAKHPKVIIYSRLLPSVLSSRQHTAPTTISLKYAEKFKAITRNFFLYTDIHKSDRNKGDKWT